MSAGACHRVIGYGQRSSQASTASNCIREPQRWENAAVNSLPPGLLSPPAHCWGDALPFVAVSTGFKRFANAPRDSHLTSVCTALGCAPKLSLLECWRCSRWTIPTVLCFLSLVLVELNKQPLSLLGCVSSPRPCGDRAPLPGRHSSLALPAPGQAGAGSLLRRRK